MDFNDDEIEEIFKSFDSSMDGTIEVEEFANAINSLYNI